jgi:8-oxo-dGTP diphosphatase
VDALPIHRSARLVIVSPGGRLLLFRYHDEHRAPFWSTVGGRLLEGERWEDAAARELREETGFPAAIGPLLREREDVYAVARGEPARWVERYFLVRSPEADPSRDGWTGEERATIRAHRWWSLAEMRAADETFLPAWLPELLAHTLQEIDR